MPRQKPLYATPQDVEQAFYDAMQRADLAAFMDVWAEDEEILCILPNGPRIHGYTGIREVWRHIFEDGRRFAIKLSNVVTLPGMLVAIHSLHETFTLLDEPESQTALILATNIYARSGAGWRLMVHHASPTLADHDEDISPTLH